MRKNFNSEVGQGEKSVFVLWMDGCISGRKCFNPKKGQGEKLVFILRMDMYVEHTKDSYPHHLRAKANTKPHCTWTSQRNGCEIFHRIQFQCKCHERRRTPRNDSITICRTAGSSIRRDMSVEIDCCIFSLTLEAQQQQRSTIISSNSLGEISTVISL